MARVVPAILTDDPRALESMVRQAETFADYLQLDFMDGRFVPSRSVTWEHLAMLPIKLDWEAHIMVLHPEEQLPHFRQAGAQKVVFHYEATPSPRAVIAAAKELRLKVGLAVNPETAIAAIDPLVSEVDGVLLLAVHPGFYGAKFIPEVLDKASELRRRHPQLEIGLDGGVKEANIARIAESGVDVIFVGSAIFLQPDPAASFRRLQSLADA